MRFSYFIFMFKLFILGVPLATEMSMGENHITLKLGLIFFGIGQILQMYFSCYVLCKLNDHKQQNSTFKEKVPYYANQPNYTQFTPQNIAYPEQKLPQQQYYYQPPQGTMHGQNYQPYMNQYNQYIQGYQVKPQDNKNVQVMGNINNVDVPQPAISDYITKPDSSKITYDGNK